MSRSRVIPAVACVLALGLALAGCGRADAPDDTAEAPSAAIDTKPATGDLSIWAMGTEAELLPDFLKTFEADNPDVNITVTAVPWQEYHKKIETAIASGATPDLTMVGTTDTPMFATTGGFEPVPEDLVDTDVFFPGAVSASSLDDTLYAVPWYVETRVLFYRKDLAAAAGVAAPTTWDEFREFGQRLQGEGATWGFMTSTGGALSNQAVLPYIWQAGAELLSADSTAYTFDTPEAAEGLSYYQSLITDGIASPVGPVGFGELEPKFVAGEVGSFVSGPWEMGLLQQAGGDGFLDDKVGISVLPAGPASNASPIGGGNFAVFKDANNRDAAWKLVRWLADPAQQVAWYEASGDLPAVQAAWDEEPLASDPILAVFGQQLPDAVSVPQTSTWTQVAGAFDGIVERVAKSVSTPEEALKQMQADADKIGTGR